MPSGRQQTESTDQAEWSRLPRISIAPAFNHCLQLPEPSFSLVLSVLLTSRSNYLDSLPSATCPTTTSLIMAPSPSPPTHLPSQVIDHSSSPSPLSLHHTSLPSESHTNNMAASARDASALDTTVFTQRGFPFLSLPPEIRNMIYHYLFAPVRDGTCWRIYADRDVTRLKGTRSSCYICASRLAHKTCQSNFVAVENMSSVFDCSGNSARSGILQTCKMVMEEALPISLICIHISITCFFMAVEHTLKKLKFLLTYMLSLIHI